MDVAPFHSARPGTRVYHDNDRCEDGQRIGLRYLADGTGTGLTHCPRCAVLSKRD